MPKLYRQIFSAPPDKASVSQTYPTLDLLDYWLSGDPSWHLYDTQELTLQQIMLIRFSKWLDLVVNKGALQAHLLNGGSGVIFLWNTLLMKLFCWDTSNF